MHLYLFYSWNFTLVGRFVAGLGVGGLSSAVPMVSSPKTSDWFMCTIISTLRSIQSFKPKQPLPKFGEPWRAHTNVCKNINSPQIRICNKYPPPTFFTVFITFGILVAYAISIGTRGLADGMSWRVVVGISLVWSSFLIVGILSMPESPRWINSFFPTVFDC